MKEGREEEREQAKKNRMHAERQEIRKEGAIKKDIKKD